MPRFTKTVIGELENEVGAAPMNTFFAVGDVNRDGWPDIVVSGRDGRMAWFENPGDRGPWERHIISDVASLECGGLVYPLGGTGYGDVINGGDWRSDELSWWENPGPKGGPWMRRMIAKAPGRQFHDEAIGDVTHDGRQSLVFWNQGSATLFYVPLPDNPNVSPWPGIHVIATDKREQGQPEEGLLIVDVDGDGRNEVVAGTHWYRYTGKRGAEWEGHKFAAGSYITTMLAVADVDGDGRNEILVSEGDPCIYGRPQGGRFAWFKPGEDPEALWEEHVVDEALLDAHSLQVGDICGNSRADVLVGEIGVKDRYTERPPRLMVYENDGRGRFTRHVIDEGTGSHHARLVDLRRRGVLDIATRPLHGAERWKIHVYYNEG